MFTNSKTNFKRECFHFVLRSATTQKFFAAEEKKNTFCSGEGRPITQIIRKLSFFIVRHSGEEGKKIYCFKYFKTL